MDSLFLELDDVLSDFFSQEEYELREEPPEENFSRLETAISACNYPVINRELRNCSFRFSPEASFRLIRWALIGKLTLRCIQAILERCAPVPEILAAGTLSRGYAGETYGLMEKAAMLGRADVLELFLDRGAGPNRLEGLSISPLGAALGTGELECVELLVKRPDLDTAWTEELLGLWSALDGGNAAYEFCRQAMVPRFLDPDWFPLNPIPIPEGMTIGLPAARGNWEMVIRICRERGDRISLPEAREALGRVDFRRTARDWRAQLGEAVDALLTACPELLRREKACRTVLRGWLLLDQEQREPLARWVKLLEHRRIAMEEEDWMAAEPPEDLLSLWEKRLPRGPVLAVDRWKDDLDVPRVRSADSTGLMENDASYLERILRTCPVRGRGRAGKLSPLARQVLTYGNPRLILEQFQPGKLLAQEDPNALLACVQGEEVPRANRNAALVSLRKEERYEL